MYLNNKRTVPPGTLPLRRPLCLGCCLVMAAVILCRAAGLKTSAEMNRDALEKVLQGQPVQAGDDTGTGTDAQGSLVDAFAEEMIAGPARIPVRLTGRIEASSASEYGSSLTVGQLQQLIRTDVQEELPVSERVKFHVYTDEIPPDGFRTGDWIIAEGVLEMIEGPTNPGQSDYRLWCLNRGIIMNLQDAEITFSGAQPDGKSLLADISLRMKQSLKNVLNEEDAGVIDSILLGDRSGLDSEIRTLYQDGGIAHILAISALHINLLGMTLYKILRRRRCSFAVSAALSCLFVFFFCEMTGLSMTSIRAMVLFGIWCLSQVLGRSSDLPTSLSLAGVMILLWQPGYIGEGGFWLSFGCVLSLYLLTQPLTDLLYRPVFHRKPGPIGKSFLSSLTVWIGTAPITGWFFYRLTPWSVIGNMLVLPLMSILMISAIAGSLAGMVSVPAGVFAAAPCHYILGWYKTLCAVMRKLPGGVVITGRPQIWLVVLYYAGLFCTVWMMRRGAERGRKSRLQREGEAEKGCAAGRQCGLQRGDEAKKGRAAGWQGRLQREGKAEKDCPAGWQGGLQTGKPARKDRERKYAAAFLAAAITCLFLPTRVRNQVIFLDVGQGDCILVMNRSYCALVDCGSSSSQKIWDRVVSDALQYYGIRTLDTVFLTHGDSDHVNGIEQMLAAYEKNLAGRNAADVDIGQIMVSAPGWEKDETLQNILKTASACGIKTGVLHAGDRYQVDGLSLTCLYPGDGDGAEDINQNSLVMELKMGMVSFLLMGDLEKEAEAVLTSRLKADWQRPDGILILKVGHHGSRFASSEEFLNAVQPQYAIISCGRNNRYGHPAQTTLYRLWKAGAQVRRTDQGGALTVRTT